MKLGPLSTCINEVALLIEETAQSSGTPHASRMTIVDFVAANAIWLSTVDKGESDKVIAMHATNVRKLIAELRRK